VFLVPNLKSFTGDKQSVLLLHSVRQLFVRILSLGTMARSIGKLMVAGRTRWRRNSKWNIMSRLTRARKSCRIFSIASVAIAYAFAYSFLSSNSEFMSIYDEVSYVDRSNNNETNTASQFDLHLSEIRRKATRIARVYKPVRYNRRKRRKPLLDNTTS
jgi:hypothetical protein